MSRKPERNLSMQITKHHQAILLNQLLLRDDDEFIEAAYLALLKRRPDVTGGPAYLRALRNGTNKLQILYEISMSYECLRAGGHIPELSDACAREGIGGMDSALPVLPAQMTQVMRAEQLLVIGDIDKFIDIAYRVLLKREPDEQGIANCQRRLSEGTSKTQILFELFTSPECRQISVEVPGLRDAFARNGLYIADNEVLVPRDELLPVAKSLNELLSHQSHRFVECAYLTLLHRAPDTQGFEDRIAQLRKGVSKIQILGEMSSSKEAAIARTRLPGLSKAFTQFKLSRVPVFGWLVKMIFNVEGDSPTARGGRAIEQRLIELEVEIVKRLEHLEGGAGRVSEME